MLVRTPTSVEDVAPQPAWDRATAEAKSLKADALTQPGGRYVVALETARMFDNIEGAVMTPEQYIAFVRQAWALIGVSGQSGVGPAAKK